MNKFLTLLTLLSLLTIISSTKDRCTKYVCEEECKPGLPGLPGLPGEIGPQGAQGDQGIQGLQGFPGLPGSIGNTGPQGDPGMAGADGAAGPQGVQGDPGMPGADGLQGLTGSYVTEYAFYYFMGTQTVSSGGSVNFLDTPAVTTAGIEYNAGVFTVTNAGVYNLRYMVEFYSNSNRIGICVNGGTTPAPGSAYQVAINESEIIAGRFSILLQDGDTFSLCNPLDDDLILTGNGSAISAFIKIVKAN